MGWARDLCVMEYITPIGARASPATYGMVREKIFLNKKLVVLVTVLE